jgi:WD40-like Beta Propeller Repeat
MRGGVVRAFVAAALLVAAASAVPAQAAFIGQNGKIAFSDDRNLNPIYDPSIYSINPDGTGEAQLTTVSGAADVRPAWSPDGQRIVFNRYSPGADIVVMNANGSGQTSLGSGYDPSWSPDGQKIVFVAIGECGAGTGGVWTMNPDGSGRSFVACGPAGPGEDGEGDPAWQPGGGLIAFTADLAEFDIFTVQPNGSNRTNITTSPNDIDRDANWFPNGTKIAWGRDQFSGEAIWTMNADGTGKAQLIPSGSDPAWSPDGQKIVVDGLTIYNADGTGGTALTSGVEPDWQPLFLGYPRPKGASPIYASLVPAYPRCTVPDRIHGPPLAFPSCSHPAQTSPNLTVGTPDANGAPANSIGALRMEVAAGAPGPPDDSDVKISLARITDVRCAAPLSACGPANSAGGPDYTGEVQVMLTARLTDKVGAFGAEGTTTVDFKFPFPIPCTATTSTSVGGTCDTITSFQAIAPGSVHDSRRAIWQFDQVQVFDGGPDGVASTQGDNSLFAVQGVFVP